jgi:hypothetical protein
MSSRSLQQPLVQEVPRPVQCEPDDYQTAERHAFTQIINQFEGEAAQKAVELGWQDADRNADRQAGECSLAVGEARRAYRAGYGGFRGFIQGRYEDAYDKYV